MLRRTKQRANRQSGTPSYDRERFWGLEAETKFDTIWVSKPVVVERVWKIDQFRTPEFMLFQNFEGRQWLSLTQFQAECLPDLVREFFANIRENSINKSTGREQLLSWVRGVDVQLTPWDLAEVFQLPRVPNPEFTFPAVGGPSLNDIAREVLITHEEWTGEYRKPLSSLAAKYWALHMFSCTNILPQNRNSDCNPGRARLIHAIGTGLTIDLPSYMWRQIVFTFEHQGGQSGLPFGGALTEIFRRKGVQVPADLPLAPRLQPLTAISYAKSRGNLAKSKKTKRAAGSSSQWPGDEDTEENEGEITMADLMASINRIEHSQEVDHAMLMQMQIRQNEMQQEQQTQTHLLQAMLDHMQNFQPPPHQ